MTTTHTFACLPGSGRDARPKETARLLTAAMALFPTIKRSAIQKPFYILNKQNVINTKLKKNVLQSCWI